MTIRSFNKIAATINQLLYPPPYPPAGPGYHVPVQAGEDLLDSGNKRVLCGVGESVGVCFKVHWIKCPVLCGAPCM